eukprot:3452946-Pyramimonas_sp.AAC.1
MEERRSRRRAHGLNEKRIMSASFSISSKNHDIARMLRTHRDHEEDCPAHVTAKDSIEKIDSISHPSNSPLTRKCNEGEASQVRSVTGPLYSVTRRRNSELLYRARRPQTAVHHANALHLKAANRVLEGAVHFAGKCLAFKGGAVVR